MIILYRRSALDDLVVADVRNKCDVIDSFLMFSEHQPPYIIAVLPRYVEIRTFEPRLLVQSVELQRPRFITSAG